MTKLSAHFTLAEMVRSSTAGRLGIDNTPSGEIIERLYMTANRLEAVRKVLGENPLRITSGYRSPGVNRAVGGSATSSHCFGYAIDFQHPSLSPYKACERIVDSGIRFDQLIHEFGSWIHISFDPLLRQQPMTIASVRQGYLRGIHPVAT